MMRQAGRYHHHYQELRRNWTFLDLCKRPELACEAAMGPVEDFGFDAAILFSDLLFPLEAMGMGLRYDEGPKLDWHLEDRQALSRLQGGAHLAKRLEFQSEAIRLTRKRLPESTGLLGFVGGPLTLFFYAVEGRHSGELKSAHAGLLDGRFEGFCEHLLDLLAENMAQQALAGADTVAVLDTCAGEVDPETYGRIVVPALRALLGRFIARCSDVPVTYYSKGTGPDHWKKLHGLPIACKGIDWNHDLAAVLREWSSNWAIQGNVDPRWLFLPQAELALRLRERFAAIRALPDAFRQGWICGLGHGILPATPEENVRIFMRVEKEVFG